jgi:hypothetical protein
MTVLRIGTRSSALALWQANHVASAISMQNNAPPVELVHIETEGDQRTDVPLWAVPGRAFFTKEIDNALLEERIDIAVHSLKDLATQLPGGLTLAAVLPRENLLTFCCVASLARVGKRCRRVRGWVPAVCGVGLFWRQCAPICSSRNCGEMYLPVSKKCKVGTTMP